MINDLSFFFIFFGGFMSWTIAFGLILEKEKRIYHHLFATFMFCLGALQLFDGLLVAGKLDDYPPLIFLPLPVFALFGPLFFLTFKSANNDSFRFKKIDYLHFSCGLLIAVFLIPLSGLDAATRISFLMHPPDITSTDPLFRLYSLLVMAFILNIVGYQIYFIRECILMYKIRKNTGGRVSPYLMTVMLFCFPLEIFFFGSMLMINMVVHSRTLFFVVIQALTALSSLVTFVIFIMEKKNINFFKLLHTEVEYRRYETSKIKKLDVEMLLSRIQSLMDVEKIFLHDDISVRGLAEQLSIEPYQLSQIINENYNENFNYFINKYRIEEAKKILLSEKKRTITSVAYAVGFNSTTVFYEWFKRIAGVSPSVFRNRNKELTDVPAEALAGS